LLAPEAAAAVTKHVDGCSSCRVVLASLARRTPPRPLSAPQPIPEPAAVVPTALLRDYLRRDAPRREMFASGLLGSLALAAIALRVASRTSHAPSKPELDGGRIAIVSVGILVLVLVYEMLIVVALRRGFFHRALPVVNTVVEVSMFFVMQW